MALINLQRRLVEVGRIRLGEKHGNRPVKRETWRITSRHRDRLEAVAQVYPGELRAWNEQWELLTTTDALRVMVLPGQTLSQWMEMWSGGGCQRRCDGERTIVPDDGPCLCPQDDKLRAELAKKGQACKVTTRLSVLLPNVPGIGCWRLESHGYNAAVELAGLAELLERATATGVMLPALLRIDQRSDVKDGQTRRYPVPVIEIEATPLEVQALTSGQPAALESAQQRALPPAASPTPPAAGASQAATEGAEPPVVEQGASSLPRAADPVAPAPEAAVDGDAPPTLSATLSSSQRAYVFRLAREHGLMVGNDDAGLRAVIERVTGQTSTACIPVEQYDALKKAIAGAAQA